MYITLQSSGFANLQGRVEFLPESVFSTRDDIICIQNHNRSTPNNFFNA